VIPAHLSRGESDRAILLLHGVGGGKGLWEPQLDPLAAAGYRVVAWDMPGYGDSAMVEPYTFETLARALGRLIDHIAPRETILLGHSMGGMVALEAFARFPERIAGLILSGSSPAFGKADGAWQQAFLRERLDPLDRGKTMADLAPGLVGNLIGLEPDPAGVALATQVMSAVPAPTYRAALMALVGFDRRALLPSIRVPTLALAGAQDRTAPPAVMQKMAERIPGARYACLPGAGHIANVERPAAFNRAVLDFLAAAFP
jgi:pimeloyl-ACP methyl ester carboxylesterase